MKLMKSELPQLTEYQNLKRQYYFNIQIITVVTRKYKL